MKRRKYYIIIVILILFFTMSITMFYNSNKSSNASSLHGTYKSKSSNFISMSFDEKEGMYYYYNPFAEIKISTDLVSKGRYYKNENGSYTIEENIPITNQIIFCENNTFVIYIENEKYSFYRVKEVPTIIIENAP